MMFLANQQQHYLWSHLTAKNLQECGQRRRGSRVPLRLESTWAVWDEPLGCSPRFALNRAGRRSSTVLCRQTNCLRAQRFPRETQESLPAYCCRLTLRHLSQDPRRWINSLATETCPKQDVRRNARGLPIRELWGALQSLCRDGRPCQGEPCAHPSLWADCSVWPLGLPTLGSPSALTENASPSPL